VYLNESLNDFSLLIDHFPLHRTMEAIVEQNNTFCNLSEKGFQGIDGNNLENWKHGGIRAWKVNWTN
jgi:hypothetical protein